MFFSERILGTDSVLAEWCRIEPFVADLYFFDRKNALAGQLFSEERKKVPMRHPEALVREKLVRATNRQQFKF